MTFDFLKSLPKYSQLYTYCNQAEKFVNSETNLSAIAGRNALEWIVKKYYTSQYGSYPKTLSLFQLIEADDFSNNVDDALLSGIHFIREIGNKAAHNEEVKPKAALKSLEALYYTVCELLVFFGEFDSYPVFDFESPAQDEKSKKKIVVKVKRKLTSQVDFTEYETRKLYIDTALEEAGWKVLSEKNAILPGKACVEIALEGMPNSTGEGFADYVLFDDDGLPLAVIEAKRTSKDPGVGAQQAKLYADCIEKKWGRRPLVYYTNGYVINLVDGIYPARRVFGYFTKDEMHSLLIRRSEYKPISDTRINPAISDRYFIQNAATAVCDDFNKKRRKVLIVMATGTGKTRCAISIVDVLQRNDWIKNILFLADRTELVRQAKNAFKSYLPDSSLSVLSENDDANRDYNARITLSTYPTMANLIDDDNRKFGIGRFDLIIVDECHRSVYNKYKAIFNYFDSMLLGLTATPKEFLDSYGTTYDLFDLPQGEPTYNYDFQTAVDEGFLVNYFLYDKTTQILKDGLTYASLSEAEKREYEKHFLDENGYLPPKIDHKKFYQQITNIPTVDLVLQTLMTSGMKTKGGEEIGKSIIFAQDHDHAQLIVDRFKVLYPEKGDDYCQLIDNTVNYASTIIDAFKLKDKEPVIAVSVDMLDTGIDVPEIVNLVFFKKLFSQIKFWQMIGRGTRTCKDLNVQSPDKSFFNHKDGERLNLQISEQTDKQGFYIFDFCNVFEFFNANPQGKEPVNVLSLSQNIFNIKIDITAELQKFEHQENAEHKAYYEKTRKELTEIVKNLNRYLINVRTNIEYVERYSIDENWNDLNPIVVPEIKKQITPLVAAENGEEGAKRFDLLVLNIELAHLVGGKDYTKLIRKVTDICYALLDKTTIPEVYTHKNSLVEFTRDSYWENITISKLERIREEVRDLIRFLDSNDKKPIITNFADDVIDKDSTVVVVPQFKNYKQRVLDYLFENTEVPVIKKIRNIEPLTQGDVKELEKILWSDLGSKTDFEEISQGISLAVFVRRTVGLDNQAVTKLFSEFLAEYNFNAMQEEFLHEIVTFVIQNGDIVPANLIKDAPFNNFEYTELFEGNTKPVYALVNRLHDAIALAA